MKRARIKRAAKRKKLPSIKSLRNKLDQLFSAWIRKRDADKNGMGWCITCNRYALLECGHFIPRQHKATRWEPLNAAGQCSYCNRWRHGEQYAFSQAIRKKHGFEKLVMLIAMKRQTVKFTRNQLSVMIEKYST